MKTVHLIKENFLYAIKSLSNVKCQHESLVGIDFKIFERRAGLMRLCFSPVASWILFLAIGFLFLNPFRYQMSLFQATTADSPLMFLFQTTAPAVLAFFIGFAVVSFFTGLEMILVFVAATLLSNGDIHVLLALAGVSGTFIGSARRNIRLVVNLDGAIHRIFSIFAGIQLFSVMAALVLNYLLFRSLSVMGYFAASMYVNRLEFLTLAILVNYGLQLGLFSLWGHFYTKMADEPSDWKANYSTSEILPKLFLGKSFKALLKERTENALAEMKSFKDEGLVGVPERLKNLSEQQRQYLEKASQWLTK